MNALFKIISRHESKIKQLKELIQISADFSVNIKSLPDTQKQKSTNVVFYYVGHTIKCPVNTGLQRLTRQLARGLVKAGKNIIFVKWDEDAKKIILINKDELEYLEKWNGPTISNSLKEIYNENNFNYFYDNLLGEIRNSWLLVPEVTHINAINRDITLDLIRQGKQMGLHIAYIYYDAIPLRLKEYKDSAEAHEKYMQALLTADLILPISHRSAEELKLFFHQYQKARCNTPFINAVPLAGETNLSKRLKISNHQSDSKVILCVGSMDPRKNQRRLIEAFIEFIKLPEGNGWKLILAGHCHHELVEFLNFSRTNYPAVEYVGTPSDEELDKLYRESSFTVFPSIEEGFGLPIMESLWYGKPCVCANFGTMNEVAAGGGCFTVDVRNSKAILHALCTLTEDIGLYKNLCMQAQQRQIPSWDDYTSHVINELEECNFKFNAINKAYYWIDATANNSFNTGVQRIVRQLAIALNKIGVQLIPIVWNSDLSDIKIASKESLDKLALYNGPEATSWSNWVHPNDTNAPCWLINPEIDHLQTGKLISLVSNFNIRVASIFYDAIPYFRDDLFEKIWQINMKVYLLDLLRSDKIYPISNSAMNDLIKFSLKQNTRINSLEHRIKSMPLPEELPSTERVLCSKLQRHSDSINILCVASVEKRKNILTLIDSLESVLLQTNKRIFFTLVGRNVDPALAEEILNRLKLHGDFKWLQDVDENTLRELYRGSDFTVFPSIAEGYGLPIVESLWNGRPCVVHNEGSMLDIASKGGCVTVNMKNAEELASALVKLIEDYSRIEDLANEATTREMRTWINYAKDLISDIAHDRLCNLRNQNILSENENLYDEFKNLHKRPLLSLCISTYNRDKWLKTNLDNIFSQLKSNNLPIEILVVDNASTDQTPEIVTPYFEHPQFRFVRNLVNVGMLGNLAVTANEARGEFIWIIGDDDLIMDGAIEKILNIIRNNPNISLLYPNYCYTFETDPANIKEINKFKNECPCLFEKTSDELNLVRHIATKTENMFTGIYALIFRRDHAIQAYSQDTSGPPFSTMRTSIPTTYYVLNYMMDEQAYWIGEPIIVVNFNVSWNKYASLQILERIPEALDLAERMGADGPGVDKWRQNIFGGIVHYWKEIYGDDPNGNHKYFSPMRFITRMKHIDSFGQYVDKLKDIYTEAHQLNHCAAKLKPNELFAAFENANLKYIKSH